MPMVGEYFHLAFDSFSPFLQVSFLMLRFPSLLIPLVVSFDYHLSQAQSDLLCTACMLSQMPAQQPRLIPQPTKITHTRYNSLAVICNQFASPGLREGELPENLYLAVNPQLTVNVLSSIPKLASTIRD
jgi:hypothetical protein